MATVGVQLDLAQGSGSTFLLYLYNQGTLLNVGGDALTEVSNGYFTAAVAESLVSTISYEARVTKDGAIFYTGWLLPGRSLTVDDPGTGEDTNGIGNRVVTITVVDDSAVLVSGARISVLSSSGIATGISGTTSSLGTASFNLDDGTYKFSISSKPGYETHVAESYVVSSSTTATTLTLTAVSVGAYRTTAAAVRAIGGFSSGINLEGFIETAHLIVDRVAACNSSLTDTELEMIERWLAAHYTAIIYPVVNSKSVMGASESYGRGSVGTGLEATPFGIQAMRLDPSGCLERIENGVPSLMWLGIDPE